MTGNDEDGIRVFGAFSTIMGNTVNGNGGDGIEVGGLSTVIGNTSTFNTGFGLRTGTTGYANNVFGNNNGGNANPQVQQGIEMGLNVCGLDTTCP